MQNRLKFDPETKTKILQAYNAGTPANKLAETYKCGVSTVYAWAKSAKVVTAQETVPESSVRAQNRHLKELLLIILKDNLNSP